MVRLDYGYPSFHVEGWEEGDLARQSLEDVMGGKSRRGRGLLLRRADLLLGWAKTRVGQSIFRELQDLALHRGLVLECRFPRHARELEQKMTSHRDSPRVFETPSDGSTPPLYHGMSPGSDLCRHHLEYEWWTGMGVARGGVALLRVAFDLAREGSLAPPEVARLLGITGGAARSYLRWMEDAALVRAGDGHVSLRHPLLANLFLTGGKPSAEARGTPPPRPARWDVGELD